MIHGPTGNWQVPRCGIRLVESPSGIRKLWESEYRDIGVGKSAPRALSAIRKLGDDAIHQGGFSTPIIADGTVFVSHYIPSGDTMLKDLRLRGDGDGADWGQAPIGHYHYDMDPDHVSTTTQWKTKETITPCYLYLAGHALDPAYTSHVEGDFAIMQCNGSSSRTSGDGVDGVRGVMQLWGVLPSQSKAHAGFPRRHLTPNRLEPRSVRARRMALARSARPTR